MLRSIRVQPIPQKRNHPRTSSSGDMTTVQWLELQRFRKIISRLQQNDPTYKVLELRDINILGPTTTTTTTSLDQKSTKNDTNCGLGSPSSELFQDLVDALKHNTTITTVNVVLRCFRYLSNDNKQLLFETIGSLPQLEVLWVGTSGLAGIALECITTALSQGNQKLIKLKSLSLHSIHFRGTVHYNSSSNVENSNNNNNPSTSSSSPLERTNTNDKEFIEFCQTLSQMESLESLSIDDVEDRFDLNSIVHNVVPSLSKLQTLCFNSYKDASHPRLSSESLAILASSSSIQTLRLKRLQLSDSLPDFLTSLEHNTTLQLLNLDSNQMGQPGGAALAYLLRFNSTLQKVSVGNNLLPDDCGRLIARALAHNHTLKTLNLHSNFLAQETSNAFADILAANHCRLDFLDLSLNRIGDDNKVTGGGGVRLASALMSNSTLKVLSLERTGITELTCAVLGPALQCNNVLERLNIGGNHLRDVGWRHIIDALPDNKSLKSLNLRATLRSTYGKSNLAIKVAFIKALEHNTSLENVNLMSDVALDAASRQAIDEMMTKNMSLKHLWLPGGVDSMPSVASFIRLNRAGRCELLKQPENIVLWRKAIVEVQEDLDAVHYLIQSNPSIVDSWLPQSSDM